MPRERGFGDDGTKATRFYKPDEGGDQMNENDEDVVPDLCTQRIARLRLTQSD